VETAESKIMNIRKEIENLVFKFGDNPKYYLEHAFRHLEVLCGQYEHDEITNQQFHAYRSQLKKQYESLIQQQVLRGSLLELKTVLDNYNKAYRSGEAIQPLKFRIAELEAELNKLEGKDE
jgi:hypothetical protein